MFTYGSKVDVLVAKRNEAQWVAGVVTRIHYALTVEDEPWAETLRYDVLTDDGRMFPRCYPGSLRAVVKESA